MKGILNISITTLLIILTSLAYAVPPPAGAYTFEGTVYVENSPTLNIACMLQVTVTVDGLGNPTVVAASTTSAGLCGVISVPAGSLPWVGTYTGLTAFSFPQIDINAFSTPMCNGFASGDYFITTPLNRYGMMFINSPFGNCSMTGLLMQVP